MDTPKISVIIPVYNAEKYLEKCLDSILQQTFREIEVICVDDGSQDASKQILRRYASQDARVIVVEMCIRDRGINGVTEPAIKTANRPPIGSTIPESAPYANDRVADKPSCRKGREIAAPSGKF